MWRRTYLVLFATALLAIFLFFPASAKADVNDFRFTNFDAELTLIRDDRQGQLEIKESMTVIFTDQNRGILRVIPNSYKSNSLELTILDVRRDGRTEPYSTYEENGNTVLRIGNPDVFITGEHSYTIRYQVSNVISFYETYDELYWDINGDQWGQPFDSVTAMITPPEDLPFSASPPPACYTGRFGSTNSDCVFLPSADGGVGSSTLQVRTTRELAPGETLTFVGVFPKGYFSEETILEKVLPVVLRFLPAISLLVVQMIIIYGAYRIWNKFGKDHPEQKITPPAFEKPKGVTVLQAGYVYDESLTEKAISATLIDLAIQGYVQIIEDEEKRLLRKKKNYSLKLVHLYTELSNSEKLILQTIFPNGEVGATYKLKPQDSTLCTKLYDISEAVNNEVKALNLFEVAPIESDNKIGKYALFSGLVLIVSILGIGIFGPLAFFGSIFALVVLIIFYSNMKKRSVTGVALKDHLDGLKLYIKTAEKERLKMLQSASGQLTTVLPDKSIKLFEELLPYAIIFGLEKSWAKEFQDLYSQPPAWYSGNTTAFAAGALIGSIQGTSQALSGSFSSSSNSGGSGAGGGGSAGGGGGGGGGGGW